MFMMEVSLVHQMRLDGNMSTELTSAINTAEKKHKDTQYSNTAELYKLAARVLKMFANFLSPCTIFFYASFILYLQIRVNNKCNQDDGGRKHCVVEHWNNTSIPAGRCERLSVT
jgi:hypothetical protein